MLKRVFWMFLLCVLTFLLMGFMVSSADEIPVPQGLAPVVFSALPEEAVSKPQSSPQDAAPRLIPKQQPQPGFGGGQALVTPAFQQPDAVWRFFAFHLSDKAG